MCEYRLNFGKLSKVFPDEPPSESGIYCIFAGIPDYFFAARLIYIGKAIKIDQRFENHEKIGDWESKARPRNLYCSIAWLYGIEDDELLKIECEMIYRYQPECNKTCKDNPP